MSASRWAPVALWAAFILLLTSIPNPSTFAPPLFAHADKVVHFTMYAVLGALSMHAIGRSTRAPITIAIVLIVSLIAAFGYADEWHQQFIAGRSRDIADWMADTTGALAGVVAAATARRRRELTS